MSDSNSSDDSSDDLGLFSFANKRAIVSTPPSSPPNLVVTEPEDTAPDRSLFKRQNKRKRWDGPNIVEETAGQETEHENEVTNTSLSEDSTAIAEKIRQYDDIVANICKIDPVENMATLQPTKKYKKIAEQRKTLIDNIDGVLNKYKSTISSAANYADVPQSSFTVSEVEEEISNRPFLLKMRKGSSLHRFKVKMDTPLSTVLEHLAPLYSVTPHHFILQLNDETVDSSKNPHQLGLTVVDIIEVLVGSAPQVPPPAAVIVEEDHNVIKLKVQSTEFRNNSREYRVVKTKPLVEYLYKACQDFGYQAAKYFFDGDAIDPRKTPLQLDLEDLDCLDIVEQT